MTNWRRQERLRNNRRCQHCKSNSLLQIAWRDVSTKTIINVFQKCGFGQKPVNSIIQLREDSKIIVEDFVTFDDNLTTSTGQINTDLIDWQQQAWEKDIKEIVTDTSSASQAVNIVYSWWWRWSGGKHPWAPYMRFSYIFVSNMYLMGVWGEKNGESLRGWIEITETEHLESLATAVNS